MMKTDLEEVYNLLKQSTEALNKIVIEFDAEIERYANLRLKLRDISDQMR